MRHGAYKHSDDCPFRDLVLLPLLGRDSDPIRHGMTAQVVLCKCGRDGRDGDAGGGRGG